jgi:hypothetical protein
MIFPTTTTTTTTTTMMMEDASRFYPNPAFLRPSTAWAGYLKEEEGSQAADERRRLQAATELVRRCLQGAAAGASRPGSSLGSLYVGELGLVYLRFRLSKLLLWLSESDSASSKDKGGGNSEGALRRDAERRRREALSLLGGDDDHEERGGDPRRKMRRVSLLEGPEVGAEALLAALHFHDGDRERASRVASRLLERLGRSCRDLPSSECDVLYGRAGAIQAVLFLRVELRDPLLGTELAVRLASEILGEGRTRAAAHPEAGMPLLWEWHDSWYLGAAHGVSGILQTLLCLEPSELTRLDRELSGVSARCLIESTIDKLDDYCFPSGNLDSSIHLDRDHRKPRTDRLVQWCHGAPGHVLLLLQAHRVLGRDRYLDRARHLADAVVWPRGLLRKGVGLCHGIAGNAYALLELGRHDPSYLRKARYFADFALDRLDELEGMPDRPYSLYEGLGGLSYLFIDLLLPPEEARFPLFC